MVLLSEEVSYGVQMRDADDACVQHYIQPDQSRQHYQQEPKQRLARAFPALCSIADGQVILLALDDFLLLGQAGRFFFVGFFLGIFKRLVRGKLCVARTCLACTGSCRFFFRYG